MVGRMGVDVTSKIFDSAQLELFEYIIKIKLHTGKKKKQHGELKNFKKL